MTSRSTVDRRGFGRHSALPAPARFVTTRPYLAAGLTAAALLGVSAYVNARLAGKAERANPPSGRFVEVGGVRLHVVERGQGDALVLLHGNGSTVEDFVSSGLMELAASRYRAIAIDRPGFGHSERPRSTVWTDAAQAQLIAAALRRIGVSRATVLGHSWGCSVAVALGLDHPALVSGLVLVSGYYYPSVRADVALMSGPAIPGIGDVLRYSVSPPLGRLLWPLFLRKMFGPEAVPAKFDGFPREMALRPSQIRASAAESALMIPDAAARAGRYRELTMPVAIVAGDEDRIVTFEKQSARLHGELPRSSLHRIPGGGHMVHQTATRRVLAAIDEVAEAARQTSGAARLAA